MVVERDEDVQLTCEVAVGKHAHLPVPQGHQGEEQQQGQVGEQVDGVEGVLRQEPSVGWGGRVADSGERKGVEEGGQRAFSGGLEGQIRKVMTQVWDPSVW